jgi:hypothetical protein
MSDNDQFNDADDYEFDDAELEINIQELDADARFDIAVHEAGHAVVALVLGFVVTKVTIKPTPTTPEEHGEMLLGRMEYISDESRGYRRNPKSMARAQILVALGGPCAGFIMRRINIDADGCIGDFVSVFTKAKEAGIEHEVDRLIRYACRMVIRHYEKIARVAHELDRRKHGTLNWYWVHRHAYHTRSQWRALRRKVLARRRAKFRAWAREHRGQADCGGRRGRRLDPAGPQGRKWRKKENVSTSLLQINPRH